MYSTSGNYDGGCTCPDINYGPFGKGPGPCWGGSGSISIDISGLAGLQIQPQGLSFTLAPLSPAPGDGGFLSSFSVTGSLGVDMSGTANLSYSVGLALKCVGGSPSFSISSGFTTVDFNIEFPIIVSFAGGIMLKLSNTNLSISNLSLGLLGNIMSDFSIIGDIPVVGGIISGYLQDAADDGNDAILKTLQGVVPTSLFTELPDLMVFMPSPGPVITTNDILNSTFSCFGNCAGKCGGASDGCGGERCPPPLPPQVCDTTTNTFCTMQCNGICNKADDGCHGTRCPPPPAETTSYGDKQVCDTVTNKWCMTSCAENRVCGPDADSGCHQSGCPYPGDWGEGAICYNGKYCTTQCNGVGPLGDDGCGGTRCICNQIWDLPEDSEKVCGTGPSPFIPNATFICSFLVFSTLKSAVYIDSPYIGGSVYQNFAFQADSDILSFNVWPDYWIFENIKPSVFAIGAVYERTIYPYCKCGIATSSDCQGPWNQDCWSVGVVAGTYWFANSNKLANTTTNRSDAAPITVTETKKGALTLYNANGGGLSYFANMLNWSSSSDYYIPVGGCTSTSGPPNDATNCSWRPGSTCQNYRCVAAPPS